MARERWGTFSVADHKRRRAFVADVLLYDRLIVPYPPSSHERKDWVKEGWKPDRLDSLLEVLRDDHAIRVLWTEEMHNEFKTRFELGAWAGFDSDNLAGVRERKEDPMQVTRKLLSEDFLPELPEGVTKVWAVPAYPSYYEFNKDSQIDVRDGSARRVKLQCALAHRFLVPSGDKPDLQLLKDAVKLADEDDFKGHRAEYYKWQENIIENDISVENAIKEMEQHLEAINKVIRKAKIKVYWKFAFTITSISLSVVPAAFATSPLALPLAGAGALISLAKFAKLERKPEYQPGIHAPAAMFHESSNIFR